MIQSVGQTRLVSGEQEKPQYAIATDWGTDTDKEMGGGHIAIQKLPFCAVLPIFLWWWWWGSVLKFLVPALSLPYSIKSFHFPSYAS